MAKSSNSKRVASSKGKGKPVATARGRSTKPVVATTKKQSVPARKGVASSKAVAKPVAKRPAVATPKTVAKVVAKVAVKPVAAASTIKGALKGAVKAVARTIVAAKTTVTKTPDVVAPKPIIATPKGTKSAASKIVAADKPILAVKAAPGKGTTMMIVAKPEKRRHKHLKKLPPEPAYRPPLQESVPTNGKMRKNQAGLLTKELEHFRDLLLEKRREIVGDMSSMEREALRSGGGGLSSLPVHMADMGTDNYEQEFTLGLVEKDRNLLREINAALAKIQNGTYGLCEGTGNPINKVRLEAQPWARFSIEHARAMERQRGIR